MKNLLVSLSFLLATSGLYAQTAGDYRSIANGDWSVITNWETFDGATWQPAVTAPSNTNETITIRTPDVITISSATSADQLVIDAGATLNVSNTLTLVNGAGTDLTVNGILQVGAALAGVGTTTVINGTLDWTAGTISAPMTLSATATATILGATKTLNTTVTNNGTINWNAGNIDFSSATLTNNGSFNNSFDGSLNNSAGTNSLVNTGSFTKSAGAGTTTIAIPVTNTGSISIATGTLSKITNAIVLNAGSSLSGNGTINIGTLGLFTVNTLLSVPATLTFAQSAGTINGSSSMTINGTMNWSGGTLQSTIIIAAAGTVNASGAAKTINSFGTFTNNGIFNWTAGNVNLSNGTFNNNGSIDLSFDGSIGAVGGTNAFNNAGTFTKSAGTGTSNIGALNNSGSIIINTGTLSAPNTSTASLNAGTVLSGTGIFLIDASTLSITSDITSPSTLSVRKTTGVTAGSGTFNIHGPMTWSGGTIGSPVHLLSGSTLSITGTGVSLNSTLTNDATITWNATAINFNNGSLINNGTLNTGLDGAMNNTSGVNLFNNTGTFTKTSGAGSSTIAIPAQNSGTINVNTGTVLNSSSSFINSGTINIASTRTFSSTGSFTFQAGSAITGSGSLSISGVTQVLTNVSLPSTIITNLLTGATTSGAGTVTVAGTMNWSGGTMGSPFAISSTGTLNAAGVSKTLAGTLTNHGNMVWSAGNIDFNNGSLYNHGTLDNTFDGAMYQMAGTNLFSNHSIFVKAGGASTSTVGIPAINQGGIYGGNTIQFSSTFTNQGVVAPGRPIGSLSIASSVSPVLTATSDLRVEISSNSGAGTGNDLLNHSGNLTLNGTLTVSETAVVPPGDYTIVQLSSGTISGNFTVTNVPGTYIVIINPTSVVLRKSMLPLNWISFAGERKANGILLTWKTANEVNTKDFEIERSVDGKNFNAIGTVNAKLPQEAKDYSFEDIQFSPGKNYYRIKQTDIDGAFEYSRTIVVASGESQSTIKIFPNPAKSKVNITIPEEWKAANLVVRTLSGQVVFELKKLNQGLVELNLRPGSYFIQVTGKGKSEIKHFRID